MTVRKSLINDVSLDDENKGPAIMFPNPEIRRMMNLAGVGRNDVFYDLGCGWGQNLIVALTEYHVRNAVGLENDSSRHEVACKRIKKLGLSNRCNILKENLDKALRGKIKGIDLKEATVVFLRFIYELDSLRQLKESTPATLPTYLLL